MISLPRDKKRDSKKSNTSELKFGYDLHKKYVWIIDITTPFYQWPSEPKPDFIQHPRAKNF